MSVRGGSTTVVGHSLIISTTGAGSPSDRTLRLLALPDGFEPGSTTYPAPSASRSFVHMHRLAVPPLSEKTGLTLPPVNVPGQHVSAVAVPPSLEERGTERRVKDGGDTPFVGRVAVIGVPGEEEEQRRRRLAAVREGSTMARTRECPLRRPWLASSQGRQSRKTATC